MSTLVNNILAFLWFDHIILLVGSKNLGTFIFFGWLKNSSVQIFQPIISIYRRDNFVYQIIVYCLVHKREEGGCMRVYVGVKQTTQPKIQI